MRGKRLRAGLLIGVVAAAVTVALLSGWVPLPQRARASVHDVMRRGELQANDLLLRTIGLGAPAGDDVVLAIVNQADLDAIAAQNGEGWPWPREYWAVLTRFLHDAGASVVAFDILFTEPSRYPEDDRALGEAIANGGRTVLLAATSSVVTPNASDAAPPGGHEKPRVLVADGAEPAARARLVPPTPAIAAGGAALGVGDVYADADRLVRRVRPAVRIGDEVVPTFATQVAMRHRGIDTVTMEDGRLQLGESQIPLPRDGSFALRFRPPDPPRTPAGISFPSVHVAELLDAAFAHAEGAAIPADWSSRLRGKIVVIGVNAPGIEDVEITPVSGTFLGAELQATAIETLLRGDALDEWPGPGPWEHLPAAAMALLVAIVAVWPQGAGVAAAAALGLFGVYGGAASVAYHQGVLLPLFGPLVGAIVAFGSSMLWLYTTEGRQRREIGRMFSQYVSPEVVAELQRHPEKLRLGGERRVMTAFFSDIEGFTTVSESMEPEALVAFLNDYLTRCTDLILDSGGVIDKYEGDAIIAFWNAPLDLPDHATRACDAALRCQEACAAFRTESEQRGLPAVRMRIGLNTGPMVVGNMGSHKRFDFTIMGDSVNLAARLEGANKVFGTYTMVSEATRRACGDGFVFRELGRLRVKGKAVPICVYEVVGKGTPPPWVHAFESALADFYAARLPQARAAFAAVLAERPGDPPTQCYLARLDEMCQAAVPPDFDGVLTLTEK